MMFSSPFSSYPRILLWLAVWTALLSLSNVVVAQYEGSPVPLIDIGAWTTGPDLLNGGGGSYHHCDHEDDESLEVARLAVVKQVSQACQDIGFFAITNHNVNETIMNAAWTEAGAFFDLPDPTKRLYTTTNETEYPYGYEKGERSDLKETFSMGPQDLESGMPLRRFPSTTATSSNFQSSLEAYFTEMERLASIIMRIFAVALELPEDRFEPHLVHHISALRILNYFDPPEGVTIEPGVTVRGSAHTDYGPLTILKSGGPGLQVKKDIEGGEWVDVPTFGNDVFVINLGDMMQRWTNDKWVSTLHRVVFPEVDDKILASNFRRQSIAYFCNTNADTLVTPLETCLEDGEGGKVPPKYPAIKAKDHLMAKHLVSVGVIGSMDEYAAYIATLSDEL